MRPPVPRSLSCGALALVLSGILASGCCVPRADPAPAPLSALDRLHVVAINGGGSPSQNYQSHLLHVRHLHAMLRQLAIPPERITVFASDGEDPGLDLATREARSEPDFWLLEGTRLEAALQTPTVLANSTLPGARLRPATLPELERWFAEETDGLQPGDTLLLYVTDHGTRAPRDGDQLDTAITLWGPDHKLTVRQLASLLQRLGPDVRVVTVMSQCYSGGFATLASARKDDLPDGTTCGFFSSPHDRPAYGCYPENRGRDNVGHSFHFLDALARSGDFLEAHRETLVADATPDVPLRSSDVWLRDRLTAAAAASGRALDDLVEELLHDAWRTPGAWEPEIRLLDRLGQAYGFFSPRSLAELRQQSTTLEATVEQLRSHHQAWDRAFDAARRANLDTFLSRAPSWQPRVADAALRRLSGDASRALARALLADLGQATRTDAAMHARLATLRQRTSVARDIAYRMEVRAAVFQRMRYILLGIAGRTWLARQGSPAERDAFAALLRCEAIQIPPPGVPPGAELARPQPFPRLEDDLAAASQVLPAWMGIQFAAADAERRSRARLEPGAARVLTVYPESPAAAAGLRPGDIVIGPPGAPFREPDQIREWTMLSRVDEPQLLEVLRGDDRVQISLVPKPMPVRWPALPGPPKPGSPAPSLELDEYRGVPPATLAAGRPHLLFFWATWCSICKSALPELDAFARERKAAVVAISDEPRERLDRFFASYSGVFPQVVSIDRDRRTFAAFGISGLPTFVLVDGDGTVRSTATGYTARRGLEIDGWRWSQRPP